MSFRISGWPLLAVAVIGVAFFAGRELRPNGVASFAYDLAAPAYGARSIEGVSRGGFGGIGTGAPAPDGETVFAGPVISVNPDSITLRTPAQIEVTIQLRAVAPVRRIEAAALSSLRPGMAVVLRTASGSDEAAAVLILSEP